MDKKKKKEKFDAKKAAEEIEQKVFKQLAAVALSSSDTVAAFNSRKEILELSGAGEVKEDFKIDLALIEITQDDAGRIVIVKREPPNLDNSLPMRHAAEKAAKAPAVQAAPPVVPNSIVQATTQQASDPSKFFNGSA